MLYCESNLEVTMNKKASDFKVGQRVYWETNPSDRGTVVEVGYCRVKVRWDISEDEAKYDPACQFGVYGEVGFPLVPFKEKK